MGAAVGGAMKFKGYGVIWNPKASRNLVNFRNVDVYETSDEYEISLLSIAQGVDIIEGEIKAPASGPDPEPTRKELLAKAKAQGVTGADRMSKAALAEALGS
jgi:hypothetical protein